MKQTILAMFILGWSVVSAAVDMPLKGLDGTQSKLSDYRGKWLVVNYWATWCQHADSKAVVLGINTEVLDNDLIQAFLDDYFISYPNFVNGPVTQSPLGSIPGLPTTFLVSPEGNIEARQVGPVTRQMIENFIEKWEAKRNNK